MTPLRALSLAGLLVGLPAWADDAHDDAAHEAPASEPAHDAVSSDDGNPSVHGGHAHHDSPRPPKSARHHPDIPAPILTVGLRGFVLWGFSKHHEDNPRFAVGPNLFLGGEIANGKLLIEGEVSLNAMRSGDFTTEIVVKKPFAIHPVLEPVLIFGPVLSVGVRDDAIEFETGVAVGGGLDIWLAKHVGLTTEISYRFVVSKEGIEHQLPVGFGVVFRY